MSWSQQKYVTLRGRREQASNGDLYAYSQGRILDLFRFEEVSRLLRVTLAKRDRKEKVFSGEDCDRVSLQSFVSYENVIAMRRFSLKVRWRAWAPPRKRVLGGGKRRCLLYTSDAADE